MIDRVTVETSKRNQIRNKHGFRAGFVSPKQTSSCVRAFPRTAWYLNYPWDSRLIKGRHNGGLIYFGSSYKHYQHDLADH
jgi:hypothetical protein